MNPSHSQGLAAAKRVQDANAAQQLPDVVDTLTMLAYHLSLEVRRLPEHERMAVILQIARDIAANTRESLD